MTEDAAFDAVVAYLSTINSERQAIDPAYVRLASVDKAFRGNPRTKGPYALVTLIGSIDNGEADQFCYGTATLPANGTDPARETVTESRVRSALIRFRIDVYASRAMDYAEILNAAFRSSRAHTDLGGMVPRTVNNVEFLPELVGQVWEGRAHFDVELATLHATHNAIDVIESGRVGMTGIGSQTIETEFTYEKE